MKKSILVYIFIFCLISSISQSKKNQILILNNQIDSLTKIINNKEIEIKQLISEQKSSKGLNDEQFKQIIENNKIIKILKIQIDSIKEVLIYKDKLLAIKTDNYVTKMGLKGNVKSFIETKYNVTIESSKIVKDTNNIEIFEIKFDLDGNVIEKKISVLKDSEVRRYYKGNEIERIRYYNDELKDSINWLFDIYGNILREYKYNSEDNTQSIENYIYDNNRFLIKIERDNFDGNGNEIVRTYINDVNGNRRQENFGYYIYYYEYNKANKVIEFKRYDVYRQNEYLTTHKIYNDNGNLVHYYEYRDGKIMLEEYYKYNDEGKITIHYLNNKFNTNDSKIEQYVYNTQGLLPENKIFNIDNTINQIYTHKYNDKGNEVERIINNNDSIMIEKQIYKYDDKGNQIEKCIYNSDDKTTTYIYEYKYDMLENMIKKNIYKNGVLISVTENIILYY